MEKSCEKSREVQGFFVWLRSKGKKGKGFNQILQESNIGMD